MGTLPANVTVKRILPNDQLYISGQISIIPKPELRGFWGSSPIKPPFRVTSADVVIICPDICYTLSTLPETNSSHLKMDGWNTIVSFWEGLFSGASC